ncbi:TetR/AcrR family transcriptional regulator [Mycolicibacterium holsaticum]
MIDVVGVLECAHACQGDEPAVSPTQARPLPHWAEHRIGEHHILVRRVCGHRHLSGEVWRLNSKSIDLIRPVWNCKGMSESAIPVELSAKQQLVLTAERLFAQRGLDGVPLRQIGTEAGMANKSAVQYHFGSKEGLVQAILLNRLEQLTQRRRLLAARAPSDDLRAVVEAHQLPLMEMAEDENCFYLSFLEQLLRYDSSVSPLASLPDEHRQSHREYVKKVSDLVKHIPKPIRDQRIHQVSAMCVHACADRHRFGAFGLPIPSYSLHVSSLLDDFVALLIAAPSDETLAALKGSRQRGVALRVLP